MYKGNKTLTSKQEKYKKIMEDLQFKLDFIKKEHPELNIVAIYLQGSQNYELDDELSDIDAKAICLPTLDNLIEKKTVFQKSTTCQTSHM